MAENLAALMVAKKVECWAALMAESSAGWTADLMAEPMVVNWVVLRVA